MEFALSPCAATAISWMPEARCLPSSAAVCVFRAISRVVASCSSTAAAMAVFIVSEPTAFEMAPIELTASSLADCTSSICLRISSVAEAVWLASVFTSEATTAKPLPIPLARRFDGGVERRGWSARRCPGSGSRLADLLGAVRQALDPSVAALGLAVRVSGHSAASVTLVVISPMEATSSSDAPETATRLSLARDETPDTSLVPTDCVEAPAISRAPADILNRLSKVGHGADALSKSRARFHVLGLLLLGDPGLFALCVDLFDTKPILLEDGDRRGHVADLVGPVPMRHLLRRRRRRSAA